MPERMGPSMARIIDERGRMFEALATLPGVTAYPSDANYVLVRVDGAVEVWQRLYDAGILVRDFSSAPGLENCLRISVGTREENDTVLEALREAVMGR